MTDVAFLVPVKLHKRLTELWWETQHVFVYVTSTQAPSAPQLCEGRIPYRRSLPVLALDPVDGDAGKVTSYKINFPETI